MSYTTLQEYIVDPFMFSNIDELKNQVTGLKEIFSNYGFTSQLQSIHDVLYPGKSFVLHYMTSSGSSITLRGHPPDLITIDIHEYVTKGSHQVFTAQVTEEIKNKVAKSLQSKRTENLPAIKRGHDIPVYFPTSQKHLIEYDFDKCVFEADSDFQNIKIMHSKQYGNVLLLDNDVNLAESDLPYTQAITGYGREDYRNKTVLILGGGDGGILHQLRSQGPEYITMVDIDGVVVEEAKKHLRGICHDSLDDLEGDNYKVLIADCVPILKEYVSENKQFDFVINDLTAIPVSTEPVGDHWDFLRLILDLSMKVLSPTGKYYTQGNGVNCTRELALYEQQLGKLETPIDFRRQTVCVPSYQELWVFYEIWKKSEAAKS